MVAIRRRQPQLRKPQQHQQKRGICTVRNVIFAVIAILGIRTFMGLTQKTNETTAASAGFEQPPKGIQGALNEFSNSNKGIRGKKSNNNNNNNLAPKAPEQPMITHDDKHDEDFEKAKDEHLNKPLDAHVPVVPASGSSQDHHDEAKLERLQQQQNKNDHDPEEHQLPDDPVDEWKDDEQNKIHKQDKDEEEEVIVVGAGGARNRRNTPGVPHEGDDPIHKIVLDKKGTGPTNVGYVKDFDHEREHPLYRTIEIPPHDVTKSVAAAVEETSVKPCLDDETSKKIILDVCLDTDTTQIAYNAATFPRSWCGTDIEPQMASTLHQHCTDPIVHLFSMQDPPVDGQGMPPMIIKAHEEAVHENDLENVECNIPCQQEMGLSGDLRYIQGEPTWKLLEPQGDHYLNGLTKIERINYRNDFYYSTQSFLSSVPRPMFDWSKHSLRNRPATDFTTANDKAFYLVNKACASAGTKRQKYLEAMKRFFPVDSFGTCHHSAEFPTDKNINNQEDRMEVMRQYKIVLAFDVSSDKDHISDYIWEAFMSGAVPVFIGADNAKDHLPKGSFVNGGDYGSWDELAMYVKELASNRTAWEAYHAWRDDEAAIDAFEQKYEFAKTGYTCRLCRWAYAKKYGLGWDHWKQQVTAPRVDRHLYVSAANDDGAAAFIVKPFQEAWVATDGHNDAVILRADAHDADHVEATTDTSTTVHTDAFQLQRSISQHDGVTDVRLTEIDHLNTETSVIFRLHFPKLRNSDGACFHHTHTLVPTTRGAAISSASLQDEFVKVTILADWKTEITSTAEGVVEVVVLDGDSGDDNDAKGNFPRRIRIITEDTNTVHDKMTEFFPSSFAKKMTQDFVDPLEIFYADS